ncbi:unnamed protein product [Peniophora sp. CBMAI 1063]|nr:unnamed protein product [Peniophora sp. CBMAI 1063]
MASPSPERPIRRAKVTYGKRKPVVDPDATLVSSAPATVARKDSMDEDIVPDSEPNHHASSDESGAEDGPKVTKWGWREQLKAIDKGEKVEAGKDEDATMVDVEERAATPPLSDHEQPTAFGTSLTALAGSPLVRDKGSSASANNSPHPRLYRSAPDSSPATAPPATPGEDSQDQTLSGSSPALFPISTPQDASPGSPPSSPPAEDDHELPMAISKSASTKAKGRSSVPPLSFEDSGRATTSHSRKNSQVKDAHSRRPSKEKPKKVKAPTKKDLDESRRESARLKSDQRASLPSTTIPFGLPEFLTRVTSESKPTIHPPVARQPLRQPQPLKATRSAHSAASDPIDEFSSSPGPLGVEVSFTREDSASPLDRLSSPAKPPGSPLQSNGLLSMNLFANKSKSQPMPYVKPAMVPPLSAPNFISGPSKLLSLGALPDDDDRTFLRANSDSDDELSFPDTRAILESASRKRQTEDLKAKKLRALEEAAKLKQLSAHQAEPESDDDLDILDDPRTRIKEAGEERRLHPVRPNTAQQIQRQYALAGKSPSKARKHHLTSSQLERAAKPRFSMPGEGKKGKEAEEGVGRDELMADLLNKHNAQAERGRKEKEEDWKNKGGTTQTVTEKKELDVKLLLEQVQKRQSEGPVDDEDDEEEEGNEEFIPGQEGSGDEEAEGDDDGSARGDEMEVEFDENEQPILPASENDVPLSTSSTAVDADSDEEPQPASHAKPRPRPRRPARKSAVLSDSEDEPENKENVKDADMFEPGEDKENSVSASPSRSQGPRPLFGEFMSGGSGMGTPRGDGARSPFKELRTPSPMKVGGLGDAFGDATQGPKGVAFGGLDDAFADATQPATQAPKGVALGGLDDAFADATQPTSAGTQPPKGVTFGGLDDAFGDATQPAPAASQAPQGVKFGGLADGFDDATQPLAAGTQAPQGVKFGGLADGFDDATQPLPTSPQGVQLGGLEDEFMDATQADGPAPAAVQAPELQGFTALRAKRDAPVVLQEDRLRAVMPALDITATQKARYDRIFEQEQEDIVAAARPKPSKPVIYVNESGFLTQTRPEGDDVEIWQPSPTQRPGPSSTQLPDLGPTPTQLRRIELSPTQPTPSRPALQRAGSSARRTPLGTLSVSTPGSGAMTGDEEDGTPLAPRRLFRKGEMPMVRPESPTQPQKAKKVPNVHDVLKEAQRRELRRKQRKELGEFMGDQAEESDDEMAFGWGGAKKSDDEEDSDDDDDAELNGLMDHRDIGEEELARERVQEKVAEQEAADDARLDKRVRDIATGKERQKRRRAGLDLSDSDDEDVDKEERDRLRREKLARKRRKTGGDTLDAMSKDEKQAAFARAYYEHIDDNETFIEPLPDDDEEMPMDGDDGMDGDEDEDGEEREVVAASDLQAQLREVARSGRGKNTVFDPNDISGFEYPGSDDEQPVNVRIVETAPRAQLLRRPQGEDEDEDDFGYPRHRATQDVDPTRKVKEKQWATEAGAAALGTARSTASSSVLRKKSSKMAPPAVPKAKPMRKTESLLKGAMAQRKPALTRTGS